MSTQINQYINHVLTAWSRDWGLEPHAAVKPDIVWVPLGSKRTREMALVGIAKNQTYVCVPLLVNNKINNNNKN